MQNDLIIQRATSAQTPANELLLLLHGVGSSAEDLRPLGEALALQRPQAWIVSVRSPHPSDFGSGWQWFSVQGVTEANRPARVAAAMPAFLQSVAAWQRESGVSPAQTTLIGFSQGAIMALESTQTERSPAARVIALSGRFARAPQVAPASLRVHLMHGDADLVMPLQLAVHASDQLRGLGVPTTLDQFAGLGHGIDRRVVDAIVKRLEVALPTS